MKRKGNRMMKKKFKFTAWEIIDMAAAIMSAMVAIKGLIALLKMEYVYAHPAIWTMLWMLICLYSIERFLRCTEE